MQYEYFYLLYPEIFIFREYLFSSSLASDAKTCLTSGSRQLLASATAYVAAINLSRQHNSENNRRTIAIQTVQIYGFYNYRKETPKSALFQPI